MTEHQILALCRKYKNDVNEFAEIVREFNKLSEECVWLIVEEMQDVSFEIVMNWGRGYMSPVSGVRSAVIRIIMEELKQSPQLRLV